MEKHESVKIAWNAEVSGDVKLGQNVSVWYSATVRGDIAPISIGDGSNVQDGAVVHVDENMPCTIGANVTIGHAAVVHSATIGDCCTIGMGAIVLNGAKIGEGSMVGAGALVTQNKEFPPHSMIIGSPATVKRELTSDEIIAIKKNSEHYVQMKDSIKIK